METLIFKPTKNCSLAIHGGAGTMLKSVMTEKKEKQYHRVLSNSLKAGEEILAKGESALDALEAAVIIMEDSVPFNSGGITNKRFMRVGDTSIIDSGTYAENGVCAISSTGWGEYYIRAVAACDVAGHDEVWK